MPIRFSQLGDAINDLLSNKSKVIIFIGNNLETEKITFKDKEILFGFFHAAGYRHKGEYETTANKQGYCAWLYRFLFSNWIGQVSISDHAMHAQDEMTQLLQAFLRLKDKAKIETPIFDELQEKANM